jgi:hypothetical protein
LKNESDAGLTARRPSAALGVAGRIPSDEAPLPQGEPPIARMCMQAEPEVDRDKESDHDLVIID